MNIISIEEACQIVDKSRRTVNRYVAQGLIKYASTTPTKMTIDVDYLKLLVEGRYYRKAVKKAYKQGYEDGVNSLNE